MIGDEVLGIPTLRWQQVTGPDGIARLRFGLAVAAEGEVAYLLWLGEPVPVPLADLDDVSWPLAGLGPGGGG